MPAELPGAGYVNYCLGDLCPKGRCGSQDDCATLYQQPLTEGAYSYCGATDGAYCVKYTSPLQQTEIPTAYIFDCKSGALNISRCTKSVDCAILGSARCRSE